MAEHTPESAHHAERVGRADARPSMTFASLLWRASSMLTDHMTSSLDVDDLQLGEAEVLMRTRLRGDQPTTPADLRTELNLTSAGITKRIDLVEARGLLERRPNPEDRRSVTLHLTPTGETVADRVIAAVAAAITETTAAAFSDDELEDVSRLLSQLIDALTDR